MKKTDLDLKKYEYRISATVNEIDESVRNRFKALAYISDKLAELSKQYEEDARLIEYNADQTDKPLYKIRSLIIEGKEFESPDITTDEFDKRYEEIKDETYESIKIKESKHVESLADQKGIPGFWLNAMKNNRILGVQIEKKDEKLLKHLIDIEHIAIENSNDFMLKFYFTPNDYIQNTVITKRYIMYSSNANDEGRKNIKKIECTPLKWRNGMNLLEKPKQEKGKGKKKNKKNKKEEMEEEEASFFKFFTAKEQIKGDPEKDDLDEEDETKLDMLEEDYDNAMEFIDELIPLALEYYLNIIEVDVIEEDDGEGEGEGDLGVEIDGDVEDSNKDGSSPPKQNKPNQNAPKEDSDSSLDD